MSNKEGKNIPNLEALFQVGGHIKFKVIQDGFALFGQGATPDEACEDAVEWIEDVSSAEEVKALLTKPQTDFTGV